MKNRFKSSIGVFPAWLLIFSLVVSSAGCFRHRSSPGVTLLPSPSKNLQGIRTLCIFELQNNTTYPQISADVTQSLFESIQKLNLFDLSTLKNTEPAWKTLQISADSPGTLEQYLNARKMLGVDSILDWRQLRLRPVVPSARSREGHHP